jgi:hypothetical protein
VSPSVPPPSGDWLAAKFKKIEADITALATQQNFVFTNAAGVTQMSISGNSGITVPGSGGPLVDNTAAALQSTASVPFVTLTGGPTVAATIGASGSALIRIGAVITPGASVTAAVVVNMDSVLLSAAPQLQASGGLSAITVSTAMAETVVSSITPGIHSFQLAYSGAGTSCGFAYRSITVQPL